MSSKYRSQSKGRVSGLGFLVVAGIVIGGVYGLVRYQGEFKAPVGLFDRTPPNIEIVNKPRGLGGSMRDLRVRLSDPGSGLKSVSVVAQQGDRRVALLEKGYQEGRVEQDELSVALDAAGLGLTPGTVSLAIEVIDHGVWSTRAETSVELPVDLRKGRIEPLTVQHNTAVGGAEVVIFRFVGRELESCGVEIDGALFRAFPLQAFNPASTNTPGVYGVLFPVPTTFNPQRGEVKLVAVDDLGTRVVSPFYHRIAPTSFPEAEMKVGLQFLSSKVPELLQSLQRIKPDLSVSGDHARDFTLVNETLRGFNEEAIQRALRASSVKEKLWNGVFERPLAAAPKAGFSESRVYRYEGQEISRSVHMGVDLADVHHARVGSAQSGEVVFVGDLGIYGETVIIDHGVGVSSLYGHLSAISVKQGERVVTGQEIGRTGMSGLAGGDHLHFEIRVQGVPVAPFAWWDPNWMRDHVEGKITEIEKMLAASAKNESGEPR